MRITRAIWAALLVILLLLPLQSIASETIRHTLDNGMVVILLPDHSTPVVSMNIWVNVGSFNETDDRSGISHFVEHMVFKGTQSLGPGEGANLLETSGGNFNAYTDFDNTVLVASVASRFIETMIRVLSDTALHASFVPEEVQRERLVILEEISKDNDDPETRLTNLFFDKAFPGYPYGKPVIGTTEKITRYTRDDLLACYREFWRPDNMVTIIVGDFDPKKIMPMVEHYLGSTSKPKGSPPVLSSQPFPIDRGPAVSGIEGAVHTAYLRIGFNTPPITHEDLFALDVASLILGRGRDSRLYRAIVDKGLAYSIGSYSYTPKEAGMFLISANLDAANLANVTSTVIAEVSRLAKEPVSEDELLNARTRTTADFIFDKETYEGRASSLGFFETATGNIDFEKHYLKGIGSVTERDIMRVAKKYFTPKNMTIVSLVPAGGLNPISTETLTKAAIDSFSTPITETPPLPELVPGPAGYKAVLKNGIRVVIKEDHSLPIVAVTAAFLGGVGRETTKNNGVANLIAAMLTRGTTDLTAQAIAEKTQRIAADIHGFSGRDTFGLSAEFLSQYQDEGWDLIAAMLTGPSFNTDELSKTKKIVLASIQENKDNLPLRTVNLFKKTLFGNNPYALPLIGTEESVTRLNRDDLAAYFADNAVPSNMVISIAGDVDPKDVLKRVDALFGTMTGASPTALEPVPVTSPARLITVKEIAAEKEQAHLFLGMPGTDFHSPDYLPMEVVTAVLSGMGGRMFAELREKQSLAYSVDAVNSAGIYPGFFGIYMGTAPKKLPVAVAGIKKELNRLITGGVTPEELARAKNYIIGNYDLSLQSISLVSSVMASDELLGFGYDYYLTYPEKINAVTQQDITRAARTYITPDRAILSIVTP